MLSVWITGPSRSGKTNQLIAQLQRALGQVETTTPFGPGILALAAIGDNRLELVDRLTQATQGQVPFHSTTPLGFFQDEVVLFWPLLVQALELKAQFPVRLRPENEQELATRLWQADLEAVQGQAALSTIRLVRRLLDLLQLAALGGIPVADIPTLLVDGLGDTLEAGLPLPSARVGEMLMQWRTWCLDRGLLTYGLMADLYGQHLLPNAAYRQHLNRRFSILLADDVDEYPAIARPLFESLLDGGATGIFTYHPDGAVRLGLGADPEYLAGLADRCQVQELERTTPCLGNEMGDAIVQLVSDPLYFFSPPESVQTLQTTTRAQLLRRTAEVIIDAVQTGQVQPQEVAVIAPGLDAIARYTLGEILVGQGIGVTALQDQRPLVSTPSVRALLTLLALVYPGLGRLVGREAVAEMLVVLSRQQSAIDPVRAGLLADHCFVPQLERPHLLPANQFPRWDRLGYQASAAYGEIVQWLETQQQQLAQRLIASPVVLLDRAMQRFFLTLESLPFDQLAALRELMETAQHYWEVDGRLRQAAGSSRLQATDSSIASFIQLLRSGTVTANPYPVRPLGPGSQAVTLANVFQYRASRSAHRWQFWLDAGSSRWLSGVDALFGYPLFLQHRIGRRWTAANAMEANEQRLRRIVLDLLARAEERVYLCYSELATSGQEQTGVLLSLVNMANPVDPLSSATSTSF